MTGVFTYNKILYSVINEDLKTVRTGNNGNSGPNAVSSEYGPSLNIPTYVIRGDNQKYLVAEIGSFSFYSCQKITSAYIPSSVRAIRRYAFSMMRSCVSLKFGEFSQH